MEARRSAIWKGAQDLAKTRGGRVPESAAGDLLEEVANLVEVPTPVDGEFDPDFLQLPKEARGDEIPEMILIHSCVSVQPTQTPLLTHARSLSLRCW